MPVTFKSQATGNLVMLSAHAEALLKLLGKTAAQPGILEVADMPHALSTFRSLDPDQLPDSPASPDLPQAGEGAHAANAERRPDDKPPVGFQDEPVSLRQRAAPFIRLIEQAQAGNKPIVWGV
ncbi:DUF1840 domain-containing protein [Aquabacterium parvum]|uniref:DUF1840 domain-containing protein n=1 Tax=Aquabacterium parvum TaxID=70584 RepID=UPI000718F369|nr:DUF1840 domain-containing protein [Aquabacterium parvum]